MPEIKNKNLSQQQKTQKKAQKKVPKKWIIIGALFGLTILLQLIPKTTEVTLHLITGQISFYLPDSEETLTLIESMPITSLSFSGFSYLPLEVKEIVENGTPLVTRRSRIILKARSSDSRFSVTGQNLRLKHLSMSSGTKVKIYTDKEKQVLLQADNSQNKELAIDVSEKRFNLILKNVIILNEKGAEIPFSTNQATHLLKVTSFFHNLIFEHYEEGSLELVMNFSEQLNQASSKAIALSTTPRLKISQLDFTRNEGNKKVTEIHKLWIDPIVSEKQSKYDVFLKINEKDTFTVQYLGISNQFLKCSLTGSTNSIEVGKNIPHKNLIPSLLSSILYSETFNKLLNTFKSIKEIIW